jgi:hypothetical protein
LISVTAKRASGAGGVVASGADGAQAASAAQSTIAATACFIVDFPPR